MAPKHRQQLSFEGYAPAMENMIQRKLLFLEWTRQVSARHPEILEHMRKSTSPLDRVIAKRIIQIAGGEEK